MRQKRRGSRPPLTRALILKWINRRKTGGLPAADSGPVVGQPGEDWRAINACLRLGLRGLPGGSSIARLLGEAGLKPYRRDVPLTIEEIVNWLEGDHQETGKWPTRKSGTVRAAPGETWEMLDWYLRAGRRGLPGGMTLAGLVRFHQNNLLRAHRILPVRDGQRIITTPVQLTAVLVTRGPLQQPDLLWSLRERQRKFQERVREHEQRWRRKRRSRTRATLRRDQ